MSITKQFTSEYGVAVGHWSITDIEIDFIRKLMTYKLAGWPSAAEIQHRPLVKTSFTVSLENHITTAESLRESLEDYITAADFTQINDLRLLAQGELQT